MITAVDTNVLIDVFGNDPKHASHSAAALRQCIQQGQLVVCDIVWAELCSIFPSPMVFDEKMKHVGILYSPVNLESASLAGGLWKRYRSQGGKRNRIISDFIIAAHAKTQANRLLTRDRGFYRSYFKTLKIIDPSK
ncbi:MAG: type II toxin-antitoxin system VapC family toxin [Candidatus Hinthialibacter antarcticus]|nr:type II toxin-antitoxin system VapC family toxin [Candidatus Hinthialibacter antarcticus]